MYDCLSSLRGRNLGFWSWAPALRQKLSVAEPLYWGQTPGSQVERRDFIVTRGDRLGYLPPKRRTSQKIYGFMSMCLKYWLKVDHLITCVGCWNSSLLAVAAVTWHCPFYHAWSCMSCTWDQLNPYVSLRPHAATFSSTWQIPNCEKRMKLDSS